MQGQWQSYLRRMQRTWELLELQGLGPRVGPYSLLLVFGFPFYPLESKNGTLFGLLLLLGVEELVVRHANKVFQTKWSQTATQITLQELLRAPCKP